MRFYFLHYRYSEIYLLIYLPTGFSHLTFKTSARIWSRPNLHLAILLEFFEDFQIKNLYENVLSLYAAFVLFSLYTQATPFFLRRYFYSRVRLKLRCLQSNQSHGLLDIKLSTLTLSDQLVPIHATWCWGVDLVLARQAMPSGLSYWNLSSKNRLFFTQKWV